MSVSDFSQVKTFSKTYVLTRFTFPVPIQTGHEPHIASSTMSTGIFPVANQAGTLTSSSDVENEQSCTSTSHYAFIKCYGAIFTFNSSDTRNSQPC